MDLLLPNHFIIQCPLGFPRPALSCEELTLRKLKNIDIVEVSADISSSMLCESEHWDNIDALSRPTALTCPLLTFWTSMPRLKQGL